MLYLLDKDRLPSVMYKVSGCIDWHAFLYPLSVALSFIYMDDREMARTVPVQFIGEKLLWGLPCGCKDPSIWLSSTAPKATSQGLDWT